MLSQNDDTRPIRVAVVDDQHLVRSGFSMVIESQPDLTVVAQAADGVDALAALRSTAADVVLMDVRMPRLDGIETTRRLLADGGNRAGRDLRVVVLTTFDLDEYALAAIQAGASGFLLKDAPPEELLAAIRTVHRGDAVIAPSTTRRLLDHVSPLLARTGGERSEARELVASLTVRERDVFTLIADGLSNTEIARRLVVSEATIKTHVGHILTKLGARDRVQLVVMAYRAGLVTP